MQYYVLNSLISNVFKYVAKLFYNRKNRNNWNRTCVSCYL